ncbi:hypothetical protein [Nocardioides jejuensis]|uniref:PH domain-containing protein n=1 Tax=Nocardioides jejuensis TaxID=2502782 RepID=A0A4R1CIB7_9ACTN|nr:hypothetical protein [Nocardioides jejuensis]TCJ30751.1 hypothetical protein EPD65_01570 [Nocardioides jejuensis]
MSNAVLTMTRGHLTRWLAINSGLVVFWTWFVLTESHAVVQVLGFVFGLLAMRSLAGTVVAFFRPPTLELSDAGLAVTTIIRTQIHPWAECSDFRPVQRLFGGHVRFQTGQRRRSLPAGFGAGGRQLTAAQLAEAFEEARAAYVPPHEAR